MRLIDVEPIQLKWLDRSAGEKPEGKSVPADVAHISHLLIEAFEAMHTQELPIPAENASIQRLIDNLQISRLAQKPWYNFLFSI